MSFLAPVLRITIPILGSFILAVCCLMLFRRFKSAEPAAYLLNTANGDRLPLSPGENSLGRSKNCDIILSYPTVSRLHAVISRRRKGWYIVDTRSSAGVLVNSAEIKKRAPINHGDSITLGTLTLVFETADNPPDIPLSS